MENCKIKIRNEDYAKYLNITDIGNYSKCLGAMRAIFDKSKRLAKERNLDDIRICNINLYEEYCKELKILDIKIFEIKIKELKE